MDDKYYAPPADPGPDPPDMKTTKKKPAQSPQSVVSSFWGKFDTEHPGKVFTVLPKNSYARHKAAKSTAHGTVHGQKAYKSYEQAKAECIRDVNRIVRECKRTNQKYRDPHFDIEWDLKGHVRTCLDGLRSRFDTMKPKGVKRVTDIFEKPRFYINGPSAGDVRQGRDGDCYLMAALCGLGNMRGLIEKVCVSHDDECMKIGVYGFVFYRDGEWQQTIIDDKLYLRAPNYDEATDEKDVWDDINRVDSEAEYRKAHQTGSRALYFAQCSDENETWLPLLEKAYAKAHGDYASIDGGFTGEAIEDLTGGVTIEIYSTDILDKEAFWREQLLQVGKTFLFGCATGFYSNWLDQPGENRSRDFQGIFDKHAYSIMDAREIADPKDGKIQRLLKVRNPWGKTEWTGKWSDGSAEWDAEWMKLLDHRFGNDGVFWISYNDLLRKYQHFDRTRIFGPEWSVSQCWTSVDVAWMEEYHTTKFQITLKEKAQVVIVLSQLDDNYFKGLEGAYSFDLQFRLEDASPENSDDYIVRANESYAMTRSVSTDIELEAGTYIVLMRITATKSSSQDAIEELLPSFYGRREKLIQIGLSYDLAHAKGVYVESRDEKKARRAKAREEVREGRREAGKAYRRDVQRRWLKEKKRHDRDVQRKKRQAERKKSKLVNVESSSTHHKASESVDGQHPGYTKSNDQPLQKAQQNGKTGSVMPQRLKCLPGDEIEMSGALATSDDANVHPVPPPTRALTKYSRPTTVSPPLDQEGDDTKVQTDSLVQPLAEVIKDAEGDQHHEPTNGTNVPNQTAEEADTQEMPLTPIIEVNGQKVVTDVKSLPAQPRRSWLEHINVEPLPPLRTNTFDTTAGQGSMTNGATASSNELDEDGAESDASFGSFEWDSELDLPSMYASSSSSDRNSESSSDESDLVLYRPPSHPRPNKRRRPAATARDDPPPSQPAGDAKKDDDGPGPDEPWNAVCTVGLRVYSTIENGVELKVIWPKEDNEKKGPKAGGKHDLEQASEDKLDPDDPAKGAVNAVMEGTKVEGKQST